MSQNTQRESQLVTTFGPGAMIDLPTRSVLIGGLERWDMRGFEQIIEERLTARLQQLLIDTNRLPAEATLSLRRAPVVNTPLGTLPPAVQATIFPAWFVCDTTETAMVDGREVARRRLVRWSDLDVAGGRRRFIADTGRPTTVTPIRFVAACQKGHIDDIDWRWVVHNNTTCSEPMWLEDRGTSADPRDTSVRCGCGKSLSLEEAFIPNRLGACQGKRPWLGTSAETREPCSNPLRFLTRTATNTYFPQVATVISLPAAEDDLTKAVQECATDLAEAHTVADIAAAKRFNAQLREKLGDFSDDAIFQRLQQVREQSKADSTVPPKIAEFDVFTSGQRLIGENRADSRLHAETLSRETWSADDHIGCGALLKNVVAVHRLREVSCLYGFTRFEAAPSEADDELEDVYLAVDGATLSQQATWLPAVEQFGEGIFLHFDETAVQAWLGHPEVQARVAALLEGHDAWAASRFQTRRPDFPGGGYVMLHSLSHALMTEIALDCGYPASSLKERIYAIGEKQTGAPQRCGILIYTATSGALGTLGGLVAAAGRISTIMEAALERLRLCSNDPVCADHAPQDSKDERALHGAACHGCLLIAETSCEVRNVHLDRALVIDTIGDARAAFFSDQD